MATLNSLYPAIDAAFCAVYEANLRANNTINIAHEAIQGWCKEGGDDGLACRRIQEITEHAKELSLLADNATTCAKNVKSTVKEVFEVVALQDIVRGYCVAACAVKDKYHLILGLLSHLSCSDFIDSDEVSNPLLSYEKAINAAIRVNTAIHIIWYQDICSKIVKQN